MDLGRASQHRPPGPSGLRRSTGIWALAVLLAACGSSTLPASVTPEPVARASSTGSAAPSTRVSTTGAESAATVTPAPSTAGAAPSVDLAHPVGIIAIGHSGLTGQGAGATDESASEASWATGTLPEVDSIYMRLVADVPETKGQVANTAIGGAEASALIMQATSALARVPAPRLAIAQTLDNDIRCDGSNVADVGASLADALRTVHDASPKTVILVLKQPGRPSVASIERIVAADPTQVQGFTSGDECSFFDADAKIQRNGIKKLNDVIDAYEAEMARVCGLIPHCFTDGGIGRAWVDDLAHLSGDYVHYNVAGQAKEAAKIWPRVAEILGL
jgi:hypothetical protein